MYPDLGSVYLTNSSLKPGEKSWTDTALVILKVLAYIALSMVAVLFIVKRFFKLRRRRTERYRLRPLNRK